MSIEIDDLRIPDLMQAPTIMFVDDECFVLTSAGWQVVDGEKSPRPAPEHE